MDLGYIFEWMYVVWISEGKVRSDLHFSIRILSSSIRILSSIEDGRSPPLTREKHPQNKHDKPATWVIAWYPFLRIYVLLQLYLKDHPNEVIFCFFLGWWWFFFGLLGSDFVGGISTPTFTFYGILDTTGSHSSDSWNPRITVAKRPYSFYRGGRVFSWRS